jgi:type I restriction enzyme S subunit
MKGYDEYKETKHPFLDSIPSHWSDVLFKHITTPKSIQNNKGEELLSVFLNKGVVRYSDTTQKQVHKPSEDMSKYQLVEPRDVVLNNQQAWRGSVGVSKYRGIVSPAYLVYSLSDSINSRFMNYLIRDSSTVSQFVVASKGVGSIQRNISVPLLKNVILPIPTWEEQVQIARFLDWKVSDVNRFIASKRKEIKLLEELKKSVIYKVVSHGLTPNVAMKPCELSWGESIPISWKEVKLKRVLTKLQRPYSPEDEMLICSNNGTVFPRGDKRIGLIAIGDNGCQGVREGDLLIHGMDTWHGAIAVSEYNGKCTTVVHVCDSSQNKRFIAYYLRMLAFRKLYKAISNGVRQNTSDFRSWSKAGEIVIALPPLDEQNAIADYLDARCSEIDQMIEALQKEIFHMIEYRTRMISDVVTGKVDVRGIEVPIPEYEIESDPIDEDNDNEEEPENTDEMEVIENVSD